MGKGLGVHWEHFEALRRPFEGTGRSMPVFAKLKITTTKSSDTW